MDRWCSCEEGKYGVYVGDICSFCEKCRSEIFYREHWHKMDNNWMIKLKTKTNNIDVEFNYLNEIHKITDFKIKPQSLNVNNDTWLCIREKVLLDLTGESNNLPILLGKDLIRNYTEE
jgi:hypothetical protein